MSQQIVETEPGDTEPGDTEPGDTGPGDTEPGNTEPGDTEPGDAEPGDAEQGDAEPGDTEQYNYLPLNQLENDIRVVELLPESVEDDKIACRLRHVPLVRPPLYTALSYCWGDQSDRRTITVDGRPLSVTANLEFALRQMRKLGYDRLWVDAICINQDDQAERSAQVLRMLSIYRQAGKVLIWLGSEEAGSDRVVAMLSELREDLPLPLMHHKSTKSPLSREQYATWTELQSFLSRPYWQRLWVIQEVAAASNEITIACGESQVQWRKIELLLGKLRQQPENAQKSWEPLDNLLRARADLSQSNPVSLLDQIWRSRSSSCTDSRDKVFGVLGLTFDWRLYLAEANYTMPADALCQSMTESIIQSKQSLDFILLRQPDHHRESIPSWSPDYLSLLTRPFSENTLKYVLGKDDRFRQGFQLPRWSAAGESRAAPDLINFSSGIIRTRGYQIGTINGLGRLVEDHESPFPQQDMLSCHDAAPNDFKPFGTLLRTLMVYDKNYSKYTDLTMLLLALWSPTWKFLPDYMHNDGEYIKAWLEANASLLIRGRKIKEWVTSWRSMRRTSFHGLVEIMWLFALGRRPLAVFDSSRIQSLAVTLKEGMRLMTLTDGYVGWAHPDARLGDKVFLLTGCSMPVILKHEIGNARGFVVVGHAIVDGVMNGELWNRIPGKMLMDVSIC